MNEIIGANTPFVRPLLTRAEVICNRRRASQFVRYRSCSDICWTFWI